MKSAPGKRKSAVKRRPNQQQRKQYFRARWQRVRQLVLGRDKGLCQECKRQGIVRTGNEVDHIEPAVDRPDLFYRLSNLQTLCRTHHQEKTNAGR